MNEKYEMSDSCNIRANRDGAPGFVYLAQCYCDVGGRYGPGGEGRTTLTALIERANWCLEHRAFAEAAEKAITADKALFTADDGIEFSSTFKAIYATLALLPAEPEPEPEPTGPEQCRKHLRRAVELLATIPISADDLFEVRDQLKAGINDLKEGGD